MSLRTPALLATLATLVVLAAAPGAAAVAVYGHDGTVSGNPLAANTQLEALLKPMTSAVINSSIGSISCTASSLKATTGVNGGATVALTASVLTLSPCTDTLALLTITGCTLHVDANNSFAMATGAVAGTAGMVTSIPMFATLTLKCAIHNSANSCYVRIVNQTGSAAYTFNGGQMITASELSYPAAAAVQPAMPGSSGGCPSMAMTLGLTWSSLKVVGGNLVGFNNAV